MIVYKAENIINNKLYIGCTTNTLDHRMNQHFRDVKRTNRPKTAFLAAIEKYGQDSFIFTQIDEAQTIEELFEKEEYYIEKFKTLVHQNGYNLTTGGKAGKRFNSTKEKIGKKKKELWKDQDISEKMLNGLKKGTEKWIEICEDNLVLFKCETCGKEKMVQPHIAKRYKYCSHECVPYNIDALKKATKVNIENRIDKHSKIRSMCLEWCYKNIDTVVNASYNSVTTDLDSMIKLVIDEFGTKDLRTISVAICGKPSKKEMLKYLKECVKIYAEPDQN